MADAAAGEFWNIFGGFAPLPRKVYSAQSKSTTDAVASKLYLYVFFFSCYEQNRT